ncbi:hypothetical protein HHI36_010372 [Cryptolaemus montrouzieri]|uniref:Uncharacterized protein n=1 Tax=Cryptolaemus montrouzieri TaxID=559131 RepID=A0ABD2MIL0_9CUCU
MYQRRRPCVLAVLVTAAISNRLVSVSVVMSRGRHEWGGFGLIARAKNLTDRATSTAADLKEAEAEVSRLQKLLDAAIKTRDNALGVSRKIQDELATVSREAAGYRTQLTKSQEQIENLKLQSQQYIGEVKKAEEILASKEKEREELLNQFKQLYKETNHLQSNNSALEGEATQNRVQLSVAMDHVNNLEQRSETMEILISDYEKQIGLLTNQIAKFESERNQHHLHLERTEAELKTIRELCMKLDKEKEQLRLQLLHKNNTGDKIKELQLRNEDLTVKLTDSATKLSAVEKLLGEARHDGVEMKLKDEEAVNEIQFLKKRIADLEQRLATALQDVDTYQAKTLEYSNQQLRALQGLTVRYNHILFRFHCDCLKCTEKCSIGGTICKNKCLEVVPTKGGGMIVKQKMSEAADRPFHTSLAASFTNESSVGASITSKKDPVIASAQVIITDQEGSETLRVDITSQPSSPRNSDGLSKSSVQVSVNEGNGEELTVKKTTVKGVMSARPATPRTVPGIAPAFPTTRDVMCNCQSSSTSGSSNKSVNCRLELDKLKASLTQALMGSIPGAACKTGKCYPDCRLFDPLNQVCERIGSGRKARILRKPKTAETRRVPTPPSDGDDSLSRSPCCPSTCRCTSR